jgi:hypothetical protein
MEAENKKEIVVLLQPLIIVLVLEPGYVVVELHEEIR